MSISERGSFRKSRSPSASLDRLCISVIGSDKHKRVYRRAWLGKQDSGGKPVPCGMSYHSQIAADTVYASPMELRIYDITDTKQLQSIWGPHLHLNVLLLPYSINNPSSKKQLQSLFASLAQAKIPLHNLFAKTLIICAFNMNSQSHLQGAELTEFEAESKKVKQDLLAMMTQELGVDKKHLSLLSSDILMMETARNTDILPDGYDWRQRVMIYTLRCLICEDRARELYMRAFAHIPNPIVKMDMKRLRHKFPSWTAAASHRQHILSAIAIANAKTREHASPESKSSSRLSARPKLQSAHSMTAAAATSHGLTNSASQSLRLRPIYSLDDVARSVLSPASTNSNTATKPNPKTPTTSGDHRSKRTPSKTATSTVSSSSSVNGNGHSADSKKIPGTSLSVSNAAVGNSMMSSAHRPPPPQQQPSTPVPNAPEHDRKHRKTHSSSPTKPAPETVPVHGNSNHNSNHNNTSSSSNMPPNVLQLQLHRNGNGNGSSELQQLEQKKHKLSSFVDAFEASGDGDNKAYRKWKMENDENGKQNDTQNGHVHAQHQHHVERMNGTATANAASTASAVALVDDRKVDLDLDCGAVDDTEQLRNMGLHQLTSATSIATNQHQHTQPPQQQSFPSPAMHLSSTLALGSEEIPRNTAASASTTTTTATSAATQPIAKPNGNTAVDDPTRKSSGTRAERNENNDNDDEEEEEENENSESATDEDAEEDSDAEEESSKKLKAKKKKKPVSTSKKRQKDKEKKHLKQFCENAKISKYFKKLSKLGYKTCADLLDASESDLEELSEKLNLTFKEQKSFKKTVNATKQEREPKHSKKMSTKTRKSKKTHKMDDDDEDTVSSLSDDDEDENGDQNVPGMFRELDRKPSTDKEYRTHWFENMPQSASRSALKEFVWKMEEFARIEKKCEASQAKLWKKHDATQLQMTQMYAEYKEQIDSALERAQSDLKNFVAERSENILQVQSQMKSATNQMRKYEKECLWKYEHGRAHEIAAVIENVPRTWPALHEVSVPSAKFQVEFMPAVNVFPPVLTPDEMPFYTPRMQMTNSSSDKLSLSASASPQEQVAEEVTPPLAQPIKNVGRGMGLRQPSLPMRRHSVLLGDVPVESSSSQSLPQLHANSHGNMSGGPITAAVDANHAANVQTLLMQQMLQMLAQQKQPSETNVSVPSSGNIPVAVDHLSVSSPPPQRTPVTTIDEHPQVDTAEISAENSRSHFDRENQLDSEVSEPEQKQESTSLRMFPTDSEHKEHDNKFEWLDAAQFCKNGKVTIPATQSEKVSVQGTVCVLADIEVCKHCKWFFWDVFVEKMSNRCWVGIVPGPISAYEWNSKEFIPSNGVGIESTYGVIYNGKNKSECIGAPKSKDTFRFKLNVESECFYGRINDGEVFRLCSGHQIPKIACLAIVNNAGRGKFIIRRGTEY